MFVNSHLRLVSVTWMLVVGKVRDPTIWGAVFGALYYRKTPICDHERHPGGRRNGEARRCRKALKVAPDEGS